MKKTLTAFAVLAVLPLAAAAQVTKKTSRSSSPPACRTTSS